MSPAPRILYAFGHCRTAENTEIRYPSAMISRADRSHLQRKSTDRQRRVSLYARMLLSGLCRQIGVRMGLQFRPGGQPFLECAPHIGVSISHTGGFAAACLNMSGPCGIDVEATNRPFPRDAEAFFHLRERRAALSGPDRSSRSFMLWSCREALAKALGRPILSLDSEDGWFECRNSQWQFHGHEGWRTETMRPGAGLVLAICHTARRTGGTREERVGWL